MENGEDPEIIQRMYYYLPSSRDKLFGMPMQGNWTNTTQYQDRYTYNHKEQVTGIEWFAYGARYYDPATSRFTSIDRFAEKYAFQSPYAYAANNPIKFIDVNGDSIWIAFKGSNYLYDNGNLFNRDGTAYNGKVKGFLKQTVKALNKLNETDEGSSILSDLSKSENNFTIERGLNRFLPDDHGSDGINIVTNNTYALQVLEQGELLAKHLPFTQIGDGGTIYWQGNGAITLGHELAHAHDANYGLLDTRTVEINGGRAEIREIRAVYKENRIRGQMGKRLRKNYSGGPSLLDTNKQPINYINPFFINLMNAIR